MRTPVLPSVSTTHLLTIHLLVLAALAYPNAAQAVLTMTLEQRGSDVFLEASGSLNLAALTEISTIAGNDGLAPSGTEAPGAVAGTEGGNMTFYSGVSSGPASFGTGPSTNGTSISGGLTGIYGESTTVGGGTPPYIAVPEGYSSGASLNARTVFNATTLEALGAEPGVYTWSWGSGADADSLVLRIGPARAVPALPPVAIGLLSLALALLSLGTGRRVLQRPRAG